LGKAGFLCVDLPIQYGGCCGGFNMSVMVIEVLSQRGFVALATNVSVHSDIVVPYLSRLGNEYQKQKWLPLLA
jgi:acyl-CoA dehydrogenase